MVDTASVLNSSKMGALGGNLAVGGFCSTIINPVLWMI